MRIALFVPSGIAPASSIMYIPVLTQLVERLSKHCELTVYSLCAFGEQRNDFICGNAVVKYLPAHWSDAFLTRLYAFLSAFRRDHGKLRFDLVHGIWALPSGFGAVIAGKLTAIPSIVSFLGGETASVPQIRYGYMLSLRKRMLLRWICQNASCVHLLTAFQQEQMERHKITPKRLAIFPFGVDIDEFSSNGELSLKPPYHFLHIANLTEVKDQPTLLRAFRKITEHVPGVLRIVGHDYLDGAIQKLAHELQLGTSVEFSGFVPHHELGTHYLWAHILLQTSLHESQALTVVEAMSSGTVVAGTRVGLLADLTSACVLTVEPGDSEGLAERVLSLLRDPKEFAALRSRARTWAGDHDIKWTGQQFNDLYKGTSKNLE